MAYRIVTDSSSDLLSLPDVPFDYAPLHILVGEEEFVDDRTLDVDHFNLAVKNYKGKMTTSCPSPQEWENTFGEEETIFCITITSGLSGSYRSAIAAKDAYESDHPDRHVYVIDSLSAGPELIVIAERVKELLDSGMAPEKVYETILATMEQTHLCFMLSSVDNFAKNGRISPIIAKGVGVLGIRILGQASTEGTLELLDKCRGDRKAYTFLVHYLKEHHYDGKTIHITHNQNEAGATELIAQMKAAFPDCPISLHKGRALVSFYAEPGSILVGFSSTI